MNLFDLTGFQINKTDIKLTNYFVKCLKPFEVTPEQWGIISVLSTDKEVTQKELSAAIDRNQTTVVRMVVLLEKKGLVLKKHNHQDKRSHFITLTKKGHELKQKLIPVVQSAHDRISENITEEQTEQLHEILKTLYKNADKYL